MADNIPQSIDYTSRDFYSLKSDLITRIKSRLTAAGKQWTGTDPSDFGVAIVEAFAHIGDLTSYYIDRAANESYLATATSRQSVLNLADMYGYTPSNYRQSSVELTFTNSSTDGATVPAGTQVSVDVLSAASNIASITKVFFTIASDVLVPAADALQGNGTTTGLAFHGVSCASLASNAANPDDSADFAAELLGYSTGFANQSYTLSSNHVADGTVEVFVNNGNSYSQWTEVAHLADYGPTSAVYTRTVDANNYVSITFGDGISGAVPVTGAAIKSLYVIGGGEEGNLPGGQTFTATYIPASSGVSLTDLMSISITSSSTEAATGGEDPESNDSIRNNAPLAFRAMNRAVTLADFQALALSVSGVGKAKAYATSPNSVLLYVSPAVSDTSQNYYPGYNSANTALSSDWYSLESSTQEYLSPRSQIGTTITYAPPVYTPVYAAVEYEKEEGYDHDQIKQAISYAIVYGYGYNFIDFDYTIYPEQIQSLLISIPGIKTARLIGLYLDPDTSGVYPISLPQGQLPVFTDANTSSHPISSLKLLEASTGTITPVFQPTVTSYRITDSSSSTITFTPTRWTTETITVNGTTVSSGSASSSISTPSGATTRITIVCTSADTYVATTYTIDVIR